MKLQLEFEDNDLREMIEQYFSSNGFKVKNLDDLCNKFKVAFPTGIKVQAETTATNGATVTSSDSFQDVEEIVQEDPVDLSKPRTIGITNVPMSKEDLMDPTPGKVPTVEEQRAQSEREIEHILAQSSELEQRQE
jgi:hypothetical protein